MTFLGGQRKGKGRIQATFFSREEEGRGISFLLCLFVCLYLGGGKEIRHILFKISQKPLKAECEQSQETEPPPAETPGLCLLS